MKVLYYIDLPYACFGIETLAGIVINAAPIAKWMIGKPIPYEWIERKGGGIREATRNNQDEVDRMLGAEQC